MRTSEDMVVKTKLHPLLLPMPLPMLLLLLLLCGSLTVADAARGGTASTSSANHVAPRPQRSAAAGNSERKVETVLRPQRQ